MHGPRLLLPLLALVALGTLNTGCGILGWAVTPRTDEVSYAVPHTEVVEVRSNPDNALVLVDGAEAGRTPKAVRVSTTEVRRIRQQSRVPGLIGLCLDLGLFGAATVGFADAHETEAALLSAGVGLGVLFLGTHLVFGRSVAEDSSDVQPVNVEIGVRYPGYADQSRRIRVPDLNHLDFILGPQPAPAAPPLVPGDAPRAAPSEPAPRP